MGNRKGRQFNLVLDLKLREDLEKYANLNNTSMTEVIIKSINKELEGKLLTNDFIPLNKEYYFNKFIKLENERLAKPDLPPSNEFESTNIIKKIPNNLDTFNKKYGKFCFGDDPNKHKGIYYYPELNFPREHYQYLGDSGAFESIEEYYESIEKFNEDTYERFYIFDYDETEMYFVITRVSRKRLDYLIKTDFKGHEEVYNNLIELYDECISSDFEDIKNNLPTDVIIDFNKIHI